MSATETKIYTLTRFNKVTNKEEILCYSAKLVPECHSSFTGELLRKSSLLYNFDFCTPEEMEKKDLRVYTTTCEEEFTGRNIPLLEDEDFDHIFAGAEFYTVRSKVVKLEY